MANSNTTTKPLLLLVLLSLLAATARAFVVLRPPTTPALKPQQPPQPRLLTHRLGATASFIPGGDGAGSGNGPLASVPVSQRQAQSRRGEALCVCVMSWDAWWSFVVLWADPTWPHDDDSIQAQPRVTCRGSPPSPRPPTD